MDKALSEQLNFPRHTGIREASLLLVREKSGRYTLLREPLFLDRCIVCTETDWEDYFEVQEISSKDTFIFKVIYFFHNNIFINTCLILMFFVYCIKLGRRWCSYQTMVFTIAISFTGYGRMAKATKCSCQYYDKWYDDAILGDTI